MELQEFVIILIIIGSLYALLNYIIKRDLQNLSERNEQVREELRMIQASNQVKAEELRQLRLQNQMRKVVLDAEIILN